MKRFLPLIIKIREWTNAIISPDDWYTCFYNYSVIHNLYIIVKRTLYLQNKLTFVQKTLLSTVWSTNYLHYSVGVGFNGSAYYRNPLCGALQSVLFREPWDCDTRVSWSDRSSTRRLHRDQAAWLYHNTISW